jgi:hypothetical protein
VSGDLRFENHLTLLEFGERLAAEIPHALHEGAEIILADSLTKAPEAPKESGDNEPHLNTTGRINDSRGGDNAVGIEYTSIYASYVHEHLGFKHPHGGQAKFLESAMIEKQDDAIRKVADVLSDVE